MHEEYSAGASKAVSAVQFCDIYKLNASADDNRPLIEQFTDLLQLSIDADDIKFLLNNDKGIAYVKQAIDVILHYDKYLSILEQSQTTYVDGKYLLEGKIRDLQNDSPPLAKDRNTTMPKLQQKLKVKNALLISLENCLHILRTQQVHDLKLIVENFTTAIVSRSFSQSMRTIDKIKLTQKGLFTLNESFNELITLKVEDMKMQDMIIAKHELFQSLSRALEDKPDSSILNHKSTAANNEYSASILHSDDDCAMEEPLLTK